MTVVGVDAERRGLQRVRVAPTAPGEPEPAYVLVDLTGPVAVGDEVVVNTTAVDLGLGTGGWHVVHHNLSTPDWSTPGGGPVMKLRYTSLQIDTGAVEECDDLAVGLPDDADLGGVPVVVCGLHSQVPCVLATLRCRAPEARMAYVMTDGAALPLVLSDVVAASSDAGLIAATITAGHAFGGDYEAVTLASALLVARHVAGADAVVVAMGPGVVGTNSRYGFTALEVAPILDAVESLGGAPVATLRFSSSDPRPRHQGVSHHSLTALGLTRARAHLGVPEGSHGDRARSELTAAGLDENHDVTTVDGQDVSALLADHGLTVTTMGRGPSADPGFFALAGAAGTLAATLMSST